jgi:hypothetical protein
MRGWSDFNLPPGCYNSDPYFNQEDDDTCEHSAPTCALCQDEDAKAKAAEEQFDKLRDVWEADRDRENEQGDSQRVQR